MTVIQHFSGIIICTFAMLIMLGIFLCSMAALLHVERPVWIKNLRESLRGVFFVFLWLVSGFILTAGGIIISLLLNPSLAVQAENTILQSTGYMNLAIHKISKVWVEVTSQVSMFGLTVTCILCGISWIWGRLAYQNKAGVTEKVSTDTLTT